MPLSTVWQAERGELGGGVGPGQDLGQRLAGAVLLAPAPRAARAPRPRGRPRPCRTRSCRACSASSPTRPPAAESAVTRKRSGLRRTRSMAWVPMDPVEPRTTMSRRPSARRRRRGAGRRGGWAVAHPPIVAAPRWSARTVRPARRSAAPARDGRPRARGPRGAAEAGAVDDGQRIGRWTLSLADGPGVASAIQGPSPLGSMTPSSSQVYVPDEDAVDDLAVEVVGVGPQPAEELLDADAGLPAEDVGQLVRLAAVVAGGAQDARRVRRRRSSRTARRRCRRSGRGSPAWSPSGPASGTSRRRWSGRACGRERST